MLNYFNYATKDDYQFCRKIYDVMGNGVDLDEK